ncbi:glycosyltransferase family 2 protein [Candidatus Chlorohelix sp.]|uniref:glycosyltransferase family 2 protein n=1 Tax=Candidatus Chlorohelix sp. TaxID=3139201 RepID=UPI0030644967
MPFATVDLSIIIVNWNTRDLLLQTIESVYSNPPGGFSYEIIVVDNGSVDGSIEALKQRFPKVRLIANRGNRGFGAANNQGLGLAYGRYSLMLNSDTIVLPECLQQVTEFMEFHPKVALIGVRLLNADGSFQGSYTGYLNLWREFLILTGLGRKLYHPLFPNSREQESYQIKPVAAVQGAFMLFNTAILKEIGGFDEQFFMYGEENDLSFRLRKAGKEVYYLGNISIIHLGSQSSDKRWRKLNWQLQNSKQLLFKKHYGSIYAMLFKLMVIFAALSKMATYRIKKMSSPNSVAGTPENWFRWSEFKQFLRA